MRIVFASAELAPLCQSGGLGDAVSGLARALGGQGHDVTCVLPGYQDVLDVLRLKGRGTLAPGTSLNVGIGDAVVRGRLWFTELFPGVQVALVDLPALFDRPGLYGDGERLYDDNDLRFIVFSRAAAYLAEQIRPDVFVGHDHHAGLAIAALRTSMARGQNVGIGTVQVVHNNAYQGRAHGALFAATGLARDLLHVDALEFHGGLNLLKAGVAFADRIVAVSETYAREIQGAQMGEGLEGLYRSRSARLLGIRNGIDTVRFDPETDVHLPARFSAERPAGKAACRTAVLDELGLTKPGPGRFLVGIGRFAEQKGWDVLLAALPGLLDQGATLAFLGDGDPSLAEQLQRAAAKAPERVAVRVGYDGGLARRLYAGADAVLVPSRFEPCGLVQLIAQRYGTLPVAHAVGGLVDTLRDPTFPGSGGGEGELSGLLFAPLEPAQLLRATGRLSALAEDEARWARTQERLMRLDVSWTGSARRWEALLADVAREGRSRL